MTREAAEQFASVLMKQYISGQKFDVALPKEDLEELARVFQEIHSCTVEWYKGRDRITVICPEADTGG